MRRVSSGRLMLGVVCTLVFAFLILPILIVVPLSFSSAKYLTFPPPGFSLQWYTNYFNRHEWTNATLLSLRVGVTTSLLAITVGTAAAISLVRGRWRRLRTLLYGLFLAPLITPAIVFAVAVYFLFSRAGLVGNFWGLVFAHTVMALPYVVVTVSASLQTLDLSLERAAMSLGANPWRTFLRVTLPLIRPGMLSGALFAFLTSFDEIVVALFISGSRSMTLPRQMWVAIKEEVDPTIAAISTMLVAFSAGLMLATEVMRRRARRIRGVRPDWSARTL